MSACPINLLANRDQSVSFFLLAYFSVYFSWSAMALAQSNSGHLTYNPSACSSDAEDMIYFAVGWRVLRQPAGNLVYMVSFPAIERVTLPLVEHPEEPEGCPGHPIQQAVYHLSRISAMSETETGNLSRHADAVGVILHDGGIPNSQNGLFDLICKRHKPRDNSFPGFLGCKKPYAHNEDVAYQAIDYRSPDGILLAISCRATWNGQLDMCSGGYTLCSNFVVNFSFRFDELPIGEVPKADQELLRRLDAA